MTLKLSIKSSQFNWMAINLKVITVFLLFFTRHTSTHSLHRAKVFSISVKWPNHMDCRSFKCAFGQQLSTENMKMILAAAAAVIITFFDCRLLMGFFVCAIFGCVVIHSVWLVFRTVFRSVDWLHVDCLILSISVVIELKFQKKKPNGNWWALNGHGMACLASARHTNNWKFNFSNRYQSKLCKTSFLHN